MVSLPKKDYKSLDEVTGGRDRPVAGFYHVAVCEWDETMEKKDQVIVDFQVLAGTTPKQEGKIHREYVDMKFANGESRADAFEAAVRRMLVATGVIQLNDPIDRDVTNEVKGKQCIIEIVEDEYTKKDGTQGKSIRIGKSGTQAWPIGDPAVAHVPVNQAALKLVGKSQAGGPQAGGGQAASSGGEDWSDT